MKPAMTKLAHLYQRVSSAAQLLGDGLDRQLEGTQRYVEREGLEIVQTYTDRGVSAYRGKNRRVGELALILRNIENGIIRSGEHLVIESIDRLSRQPPLDALETLKAILARGVTVHSVFDNRAFTLDTLNADVGSLLTLVVSMARANEESKVKSQRVADAHRRGRETGKITAGSIPTWLRVEKNAATGEKRFVVKEREAEIVRSMFEMSAKGLSSYRIAMALTEQGIKPFSSQRRRIGSKSAGAHCWNATSIIDIVGGKTALGEHRAHSVSYDANGKRILTLEKVNPNYYVPIITEDLWLRANRAMKDRRRSVRRGATGETFANVLRDVVVCEKCSRAMHFKVQFEHRTKERYIRFRCSGRSENVCDNTSMPRYAPMEAAVISLISEIDLADHRTDEVAALDQLIGVETMKLETLEGRIRSIIEAMLDGTLSKDAVKNMVSEKEAERDAAREALDGLQHKRDMVAARMAPADRRALVQKLRNDMGAATGSDLYNIRASLNVKVREVVDRIVCDDAGEVTVHLHGTEDRYLLSGIKKDRVMVRAIQNGNLETIGLISGGETLDIRTARLERLERLLQERPELRPTAA